MHYSCIIPSYDIQQNLAKGSSVRRHTSNMEKARTFMAWKPQHIKWSFKWSQTLEFQELWSLKANISKNSSFSLQLLKSSTRISTSTATPGYTLSRTQMQIEFFSRTQWVMEHVSCFRYYSRIFYFFTNFNMVSQQNKFDLLDLCIYILLDAIIKQPKYNVGISELSSEPNAQWSKGTEEERTWTIERK